MTDHNTPRLEKYLQDTLRATGRDLAQVPQLAALVIAHAGDIATLFDAQTGKLNGLRVNEHLAAVMVPAVAAEIAENCMLEHCGMTPALFNALHPEKRLELIARRDVARENAAAVVAARDAPANAAEMPEWIRTSDNPQHKINWSNQIQHAADEAKRKAAGNGNQKT